MLFAIVVGGCLIILTLLVVFIFFIRKFCKKKFQKKQTSHVSLRFPLPAPTGESDIMDDTQYDTHVKAPRTSSTEGSVDLEAEPKEVPAPFVPTIIRENKEDVASAPVAPPKIESRYLFEAPPPYEEDPTQTQSGGQRRMVAIKLSECCIPRSSTTTPSTQTGKTSTAPSSLDATPSRQPPVVHTCPHSPREPADASTAVEPKSRESRASVSTRSKSSLSKPVQTSKESKESSKAEINANNDSIPKGETSNVAKAGSTPSSTEPINGAKAKAGSILSGSEPINGAKAKAGSTPSGSEPLQKTPGSRDLDLSKTQKTTREKKY